MTEELKSCPFCGGDAEYDYDIEVVYCKNCRICYAASNDETAIQLWNTRHESGELPEWLVERIQQIRSDIHKRKYSEWQYKFISNSEQFKFVNAEIDAYLGYVLSLRKGDE